MSACTFTPLMKSTLLIFLLCIYSLSVFGVSSKRFYCCGELRSVTLALVHEGAPADDNKDDGCCETKTQFFKVKDKHLQTVKAEFTAKPLLPAVPQFFSTYEPIFPGRDKTVISRPHAPPVYSGVAIYIAHKVFRI